MGWGSQDLSTGDNGETQPQGLFNCFAFVFHLLPHFFWWGFWLYFESMIHSCSTVITQIWHYKWRLVPGIAKRRGVQFVSVNASVCVHVYKYLPLTWKSFDGPGKWNVGNRTRASVSFSAEEGEGKKKQVLPVTINSLGWAQFPELAPVEEALGALLVNRHQSGTVWLALGPLVSQVAALKHQAEMED